VKRVHAALAMLVLVAHLTGCAGLDIVKRPAVQAVRPRVTGIDLQGVALSFDVDVSNPYPIPIRAPEFRYGLDIAGTRFLTSQEHAKVDLPASTTGTVTLPIRLTYADMWRTFTNLADAPEVDYTLHGAVVASALGRSFELPMKHKGTFPVLRAPTFSDVNIQLSDVSIQSARIVADVAMKNPNVFALGLENLGYVLTIGDEQIGGLTASTAEKVGAGEIGRLRLTGAVSASDALSKIVRSGIGAAKLGLSGSVETPYGPAQVGR
jgi:LEA14-like dessication related protein